MPRGVKPKGESRDHVLHFNYVKHWNLINEHMETGAYVEVLTALERIISAKLWSYLRDFTDTDVYALDNRESSFGGLIKLWKKHEVGPINDKRYEDLQSAVWEWRDRRNKGAHSGGLKRVPDLQLVSFKEIEARNKTAAEEGILLAKSVGNWLDRLKYNLEVKEKKSIPNRRHR